MFTAHTMASASRSTLAASMRNTLSAPFPLMMAASKMADEISAAAVTRGIETPKPRTCMKQIHFGIADIFVALAFTAYFMTAFFM